MRIHQQKPVHLPAPSGTPKITGQVRVPTKLVPDSQDASEPLRQRSKEVGDSRPLKAFDVADAKPRHIAGKNLNPAERMLAELFRTPIRCENDARSFVRLLNGIAWDGLAGLPLAALGLPGGKGDYDADRAAKDARFFAERLRAIRSTVAAQIADPTEQAFAVELIDDALADIDRFLNGESYAVLLPNGRDHRGLERNDCGSRFFELGEDAPWGQQEISADQIEDYKRHGLDPARFLSHLKQRVPAASLRELLSLCAPDEMLRGGLNTPDVATALRRGQSVDLVAKLLITDGFAPTLSPDDLSLLKEVAGSSRADALCSDLVRTVEALQLRDPKTLAHLQEYAALGLSGAEALFALLGDTSPKQIAALEKSARGSLSPHEIMAARMHHADLEQVSWFFALVDPKQRRLDLFAQAKAELGASFSPESARTWLAPNGSAKPDEHTGRLAAAASAVGALHQPSIEQARRALAAGFSPLEGAEIERRGFTPEALSPYRSLLAAGNTVNDLAILHVLGVAPALLERVDMPRERGGKLQIDRTIRYLHERGLLVKESAAFLEESNLSFVGRYPAAALQKMLRNEVDPNKPLALCVLTKSDWNGAFETQQAAYESLLDGYNVWITEVEGEEGIVDAVRQKSEDERWAPHGLEQAVVMIGGHGNPHGVQLSSQPVESSDLTNGDEEQLNGLKTFVRPTTLFVLDSCSTGAGGTRGNSIAAALSRATNGTTVFAPETKSFGVRFIFDDQKHVVDVEFGATERQRIQVGPK